VDAASVVIDFSNAGYIPPILGFRLAAFGKHLWMSVSAGISR
jgi:hypothetical protein